MLSLATVLALAGVTQAKKPEGTPGGPPNGDDGDPLKVSQFSAPLNRIFGAIEDLGEIPSSLAEINSRGDWSLTTTVLSPGNYEICLDAFSGPEPLPLLLGTFPSNGNLSTDIQDPPANVDGNWQGPSFQVRAIIVGNPCAGLIIQESGIKITGYGVSKFSAPFVALPLDPLDPSSAEVESTVQISSSGAWYLATSGLKRRQRYDICLFDESGIFEPLFLGDLTSKGSGNLYAKGNAYERNGSVPFTLQAPSFQIMEEPFDDANNCEEPPDQETGLFINAPPPPP